MSKESTARLLRDLATELDAGIPPLEALRNRSRYKGEKARCEIIAQSVQDGEGFASGIARVAPELPLHLLECLRAGESCGKLADQLARIATLLEAELETGRKTRGALAYPCILILASVCTASFIALFAFPAIIKTLDVSGQKLPAVTKSLLDIIAFVKAHWILLMGIIGGGMFAATTLAGRKVLRAVFMRTPLIGSILKKNEASRFCQPLSQMIQSGLPVFKSLSLLQNIAVSQKLKRCLAVAEAAIRNGATLTESLEPSGLPIRVMNAIETGERTGRLDATLAHTGRILDKEVENEMRMLLTLLEQGGLAFAGVTVGYVVIATFSAVMQIYTGLSHI